MANPFEKRATEYLADTEAFLALVTPEPLITFFQRDAADGSLYDRLVVVTGTPGSGKTTLARLFEFKTVHALLRHQNTNQYSSLADALGKCRALTGLKPGVLGARVPLESEYREFWEFPYPEDIRVALTSTLLQARTMIRWLRQLGDSGIQLQDVSLIARPGAEAALAQIGGERGDAALSRAREVELAIYKLVRALVPPPLEALTSALNEAYHPFDVVQAFKYPTESASVELLPLAIFDDAHSLHPIQYERMVRWLSQREMRIGRWLLTRLDALNPAHVLASEDTGVQRTRTVTEIRMQAGDRRRSRSAFRKMARDMSKRYMRQMDIFNRRTLADLSDLLVTNGRSISYSKMHELQQRVDVIQRRVGASPTRRAELESMVDDYFRASTSNVRTDELALAAVGIMLERYGKRVPQLSFDLESVQEVEPNKPLSVDSGVIEGARVRLLHDAGVPYYVGFDALCDASSENAEQFLQLASRLVGQSETHIVRGKAPSISPEVQDRLIRQRATELIQAWDFPLHREVRKMTDRIGEECLRRSLEGNASLGGGANAWGIPQAEFADLPHSNPDLARVLKFAVAYNAIILKLDHSTKKKSWCLIELGGPVAVHHGLTLKRGGFLERDVADLAAAVGTIRHA